METVHDFGDRVVIVSHLVAQVALSVLRDETTKPGRGGFAQASDQVALFLAAEVTRDTRTIGIEVKTPLGEARGHRLDATVVLVPILRAGLALQGPFWEFLPTARIHHIGIARDENTAMPNRYYPDKPRRIDEDDDVILIDPMLATGGSACDALDEIKKYRPRSIRFANVIAAPEGIEQVLAAHPDVRIFTLAVDRCLDERKYIVPGLGDYGDRYFGTV